MKDISKEISIKFHETKDHVSASAPRKYAERRLR